MRGVITNYNILPGGEQQITITTNQDLREMMEYVRDSEICFEVKKWKDKRSLQANAYFHVLVNAIASYQDLGDDEVKRDLVEEYGTLAKDAEGNYVMAVIPADEDIHAYHPYARCIGSEIIDGKPHSCYLIYKRTHELDSKEMAHLISGAVYQANELGIDTDASVTRKTGRENKRGGELS